MRRFVDTNILLAAFLEENPHHHACRELVESLSPATDACGAHSLAEFYSVLTRLPLPLRLSPEQVGFLLAHLQMRLRPVALTEMEYEQELKQAVEKHMRGGQVYDAIQLACARKFGAERIYTLNLKHFQAIAPDLADRIVAP